MVQQDQDNRGSNPDSLDFPDSLGATIRVNRDINQDRKTMDQFDRLLVRQTRHS